MKKLDFDTLLDDFKDHDMKGSLGKEDFKSIHLFRRSLFPDRDEDENIVILYKIHENKRKKKVHFVLHIIGTHDDVYSQDR